MISGEISYSDYAVHEKRGADRDTPKNLRVDSQVGFNDFKSEWICPEHRRLAREKFIKWWRERAAVGAPIPASIREAATLAAEGPLAEPESITVKTVAGEKFERVTGWRLKPCPMLPEGWPLMTESDWNRSSTEEFDDEKIPF